MTDETTNVAEFARLATFYRLLVHNLPKIGLLVFDKDMCYLLAEGQYLTALGYTPSELLGKTLLDVCPPALQELMTSRYRAVLEGELIEFENTSDQSYFRSRLTPVRNDQGDIIAGMVVTEDITAQKQAEQALHYNETRFRLLAEHSSDVIFQIDHDNRYVYASPSSQQILGYAPDELLGKTLHNFTHPDDAEQLEVMRLAARIPFQQTSILEPFTVRFRHKQGHYVWLERTGLPVYLEPSHKVDGFVIACRDVTDRHNVEEALRESEERLRLLMESSLDAIMLGEKAGNILLANPAACHMFGRSQYELRSMNVSELFDLNDTQSNSFREQHQYISYMSVGYAELTGLHKDGNSFPVDVTLSDFTNRDGKVLVWRILRDMSDRQHYLQLRIEQEKTLTALQKESELSLLKSRMMERVAHEFRTPLATINVTLALLTTYLDRLTPDQRKQKAQIVQQQTHRLTDMLDEIGLAVKGNLVPEILHFAPIDLKVLCLQAALELEDHFARPDAFVFDLPDSIRINGDQAVVKTAIFHVLRNALHFSAPTSQVKLILSKHAQGAELQVIDSGLGIPVKDQSRIFEPFYRGLNIGETSGLGLGLTIAQASIAAHNGTIKLDSVLGQGTTVTIWLPQSPIDA